MCIGLGMEGHWAQFLLPLDREIPKHDLHSQGSEMQHVGNFNHALSFARPP